jgi:hypothetical protein
VGDEVVGEPGCLHHQLVLVEVRKVSQLAEGVDVPITEFELAAAGLVLVDDYPILRADLVQGGGLLESPEMGIEGRGAILNRELDDLGVAELFTPGARESRLPNKMVEGASEVVDRVPSNDAPAAYSVFGGADVVRKTWYPLSGSQSSRTGTRCIALRAVGGPPPVPISRLRASMCSSALAILAQTPEKSGA